ncbi:MULTISPECIES: hypothetical protein [Marinobacter]|uniref:hypothetical protein n=1 Tax=Marinobacter TaxID=2742 RepID=UPI001926C707|nr:MULTISPECIES: hypothetical protein [Marinobacter]MBL3558752.1 hypothetical protein [Marinobacter sp. JB05H06]
MNFDAFDQGTDDLTLRSEINHSQSVIDGGSEFIEAADHQKQLELPRLMTPGLFDLTLDLL